MNNSYEHYLKELSELDDGMTLLGLDEPNRKFYLSIWANDLVRYKGVSQETVDKLEQDISSPEPYDPYTW